MQTAAAQTEDTAFAPAGRKARVRAEMARMVLDEMAAGRIAVTIARAPEFYGPGSTQSFTNALVIDRLKAGKSPRVPLRDDTLRTLIWTPDASRALALLGNTPDAQNQTWHLPCSEPRLTYAQFATLACTVFGRPDTHATLGRTALYIAGLFSKGAREIRELLPRYEHDNRFESGKFKQRFPGIPTKSGLMVGLGETDEEILDVMRDMRAHNIEMLTIGQYLAPSGHHLPVRRYVHPDTFKMFEAEAYKMGFTHAAVGAMVRSSYHADQQAHGVLNPTLVK